MSFTISQTPNSMNLYLYPEDDASTDFKHNGCGYSFHAFCVDENWETSDDDTTYVYWDESSTATDSYNMIDHTTESGNINYVRVVANARYTSTPSTDASYRFWLYDGTYSFGTNQINFLTNNYSKVYDTWVEKPSSGTWSWDNIDDLVVNIECSSPTTNVSTNAVFRPNAAGTYTLWTPSDGSNYECVDEEVADDDTSTIYSNNSAGERDSYNFPNHTTESGTINSLTVYARTKAASVGIYDDFKLFLRIGGVNFDSDTMESSVDVWQTFSNTWTSNPSTSVAWTWSDIDSLEAGIWGVGTAISKHYCTQLYVVVNYEAPINPELRTTQCYAIVNYTPTTSSVTLNDPVNVNVSHSRQIKRYTFPSGEYEINDYGRSNKTLTISGIENVNAFTKMNTLKTMTHYDAEITVSGLGDTNLNTSYRIKDFSFTQEPGDVSLYRYNIVLEEA